MSTFSIYSKASKFLNEINFNDFPKFSIPELNIPYSKGAFITNPIVNYLRELEIYDSHASGDSEDFGILTKTFFGIPQGRFIKIQTISINKFKITWVAEDIDELLSTILFQSDYDWRIFDKFGFKSKSKIIELNFNLSDEVDETPDEKIIKRGIIDYVELKKKIE